METPYMALQIVAKRKYSLKGFAEGWDGAYVIVRAANETQRKEQAERLESLQGEMREAIASNKQAEISAAAKRLDDEAEKLTRDFALQLIESGMVVTTHDDGTTELVAFSREDVPTVVDALGFTWLNDIIEVATGADRLKAKTNSLA